MIGSTRQIPRPAEPRRVLGMTSSRKQIRKLLSSQKADAGGEGASVEATEGTKTARIDVVVYSDRIFASGNVVVTSSNRPIKSQRVEACFQMKVQREIIG